MECINCVNYKPDNNALTIPSKYKIGDSLWMLDNNKVTTKVICRIQVDILESEYQIRYFVKGSCGAYPESWMNTHAFKTKQELIESL